MIIKCSSFTLRPWRDGDEESLIAHADNRKIWENLTDDFPNPYTLADAKFWIQKNSKEPETERCFAIEISGEPVGCIEFNQKSKYYSPTATMGYWLAEKYWGKGIVTEAIGKVCALAFKNPHIHRIEARVFLWNPASAKVLEKNGFVNEGVIRRGILKGGKVVDEYVYGLTRDDLKAD